MCKEVPFARDLAYFPCLHFICKGCAADAKKVFAEQRAPISKFRCPLCRTPLGNLWLEDSDDESEEEEGPGADLFVRRRQVPVDQPFITCRGCSEHMIKSKFPTIFIKKGVAPKFRYDECRDCRNTKEGR